jgi:hypothetical protein
MTKGEADDHQLWGGWMAQWTWWTSGNDEQFANWKITMLLMGKSTISMAIFKFANC